MSVATNHATTRGPDEAAVPRRLVPAHREISTRPPLPLSVLFLGAVAVVVAAWGAAAPFAGPEFGYVADRSGAWQWSVTSGCLGLGPGAVALLASLVVIVMATRRSYARRGDLFVLGLVVALCGAWFVVGQYVWPVVYGARYILASTATHVMWRELAFAIGPGVILVFCGAAFVGWAVRRQLAPVADRAPRAPVTPAPGAPAPGGVTGTEMRPEPPGAWAGSGGTMAPPTVDRPGPDVAQPPPTAVVDRPDDTTPQSAAPS